MFTIPAPYGLCGLKLPNRAQDFRSLRSTAAHPEVWKPNLLMLPQTGVWRIIRRPQVSQLAEESTRPMAVSRIRLPPPGSDPCGTASRRQKWPPLRHPVWCCGTRAPTSPHFPAPNLCRSDPPRSSCRRSACGRSAVAADPADRSPEWSPGGRGKPRSHELRAEDPLRGRNLVHSNRSTQGLRSIRRRRIWRVPPRYPPRKAALAHSRSESARYWFSAARNPRRGFAPGTSRVEGFEGGGFEFFEVLVPAAR